MDLLQEATKILEANDYVLSRNASGMIEFEDNALVGFVCEIAAADIPARWRELQDGFISRNAARLRRSGLKAWNLYSVFLSADVPAGDLRRRLQSIEDDLQATRKLVHAPIESAKDVERALYPLLPIQNVLSLLPDNLERKLRSRCRELPTSAVDALFSGKDERASLQAFEEAHAPKRP